MKTLLTKKQQAEWIEQNGAQLSHKWSARGMGSSRILDGRGNTLARATGCGYDRFGAALGDAIAVLFPVELQRLADRFCRESYATERKKSAIFYGLFKAADGHAYLDGGCGHDRMELVLNAIGFGMVRVGDTARGNDNAQSGQVFYILGALTQYEANRLHGVK